MTREEAIKIISSYEVAGCGYCHQGGDEVEEAFHMAIEALSEQRWIPCSERLPIECGFYLCATRDCITILEFTTGNPHHNDKPSFVDDVLGRCNSYVTAWMPLPEPPKEGT